MEALQQLDGAKLSAMMNSAGPVVSCVFIPSDTGVAEEVQLDMTPKLAAPKVQLGGSPTFAGTFETLDVVVMCLRDPPTGTPVNPHALPRPMDKAKVTGPLLMIRMDENSEPQHFTLKEYEAYKANPTVAESSASGAAASADQEGNEDVDEADSNEDDDNEGDEEEDYMEHVVLRIAAVFKEKTGRDPTPEEVQALLTKMQEGCVEDEEEDNEGDEAASASASSSSAAAAAAAASDASPSSTGNASTDHPEDSASADPIAALDAASPEELTAMLRSKLVEAFRTAQGREPTDDEVEALLAQLSEDTELHDGLLAAGQRQGAVPRRHPLRPAKRKSGSSARRHRHPSRTRSPRQQTKFPRSLSLLLSER